jgi:hypothetical protein
MNVAKIHYFASRYEFATFVFVTTPEAIIVHVEIRIPVVTLMLDTQINVGPLDNVDCQRITDFPPRSHDRRAQQIADVLVIIEVDVVPSGFWVSALCRPQN